MGARGWRRRGARLLVATGLVGLAVLVPAAPAAAHEPGAAASDQRVRIVAITPPVPGLTVRYVEAGALLELRNDTGRTIEVLGYLGEPLLRLGPDSVVRNTAAPSWTVNELPPAPVPAPAPQWRPDRDGSTARWHDLRTDWQGRPPAAVLADPQRVHRVRDWRVPLRDGDTAIEIVGTLDFLPPPPVVWWWVGVVLLALAVGVGGFASVVVRAAGALVLAAAALGYATAVAMVNGDPGVGGFLVAMISQFWLMLAGIAALVAGVAHLRRRPAGDFLGALAGAAGVMAGINAAEVFTRAVTLVPGADRWVRYAVLLVLGCAIGLVGGGVLRLVRESRVQPANNNSSPTTV